MDKSGKSRKSSLTRGKSPKGQKASTEKSTVRSRSKSGGQAVKKDAKTRARSKSRTKKEARSRPRARGVSESPGPVTRSQTRSESRSRGPSQSKKAESPDNSVPLRVNNLENIVQKKMSLVLTDIRHDYYINNSDYGEVVRRSLSRDLPEVKRSVDRDSTFDRNLDTNHDRNLNRNYGGSQSRNFDHNIDTNYGRNTDRNFGRNRDGSFERDVDVNYGRNRDGSFERDIDRNYGRNRDGSFERDIDINYGRNRDGSFGRDIDRNYGRNRGGSFERDIDRNYGRNRGGSFERDIDRNYGRNRDGSFERDIDRNYGRNRDGHYERDMDRNYDYSMDRKFHRPTDRNFERNIERSQDRNPSQPRRFPSAFRETSQHKEAVGFEKDMPILISNFKIPKASEKTEFSFKIPSWISALVGMIILPPLALALHLACSKEQCSLSQFHIPRNLNLYFSVNSAMIVIGFVLLQVVLLLLNIGKKVGGPPGINGMLMYQCNGMLSTFLSAGIVAALWHFNYPVTVVYDKLYSLIVASAIFAYFLGFVLFIKGRRASLTALNPEAMNENILYQFYVGREINPLLFNKINVKTLLLRISYNALAILNELAILKTYEMKSEQSYTLLVCLILSTFSIGDFFWYENTFPSTFEAMYEGTGCYLTLTYMLLPFFPTLTTKYIMQYKIQVPVYGLCAIVILWIIGFYIYRGSNLQKAEFRRNPLNPALAHFETISTSRGKKLLTSGWWGFVRHPNYLGTMILHWSWAFVAGYSHAIPYIFTLLMTLSLINRAVRVDSHCRDRYQTAWDQYCSRVPYRIIPRIF